MTVDKARAELEAAGIDVDTAMRKPALYIATQAKQLIRVPSSPAHGLFSEDCW